MGYESFIARRYFRAKRKTGFISIITYVSIVGVTIGVAALNIVLSSFNGFEEEVRTRLINADAHIQLRKFYAEPIQNYQALIDSVLTIPRVAGASPVISREGVIRSKNNNQPCLIRAVDSKTIGDVSEVPNSIVSGEFSFDSVEVKGRKYPGTPPRPMQFVVTGISEIGFYEYDKVTAYIPLKSGQKLFKMPNSASWIEIKLDHYNLAADIAPKIEKKIGGYPYTARTWFELNRSLYSWMTIEKWGAFVVLCLIILVAAFNIVSSLIMIVMEKTREIGILKSMGATASGIMRIFLLEGTIVGLIGTALGSLIGFVICYLQETLGIVRLPSDIYMIDKLPVKMQSLDFIVIAIAAIFLCLAASVYPAYRASKLEPVEAIRYE